MPGTPTGGFPSEGISERLSGPIPAGAGTPQRLVCDGKMNPSPHTVRATPPVPNPAESFWLRNTLKAYEVQELDGQDIARVLPQIVVGGGEREESEPADPDPE